MTFTKSGTTRKRSAGTKVHTNLVLHTNMKTTNKMNTINKPSSEDLEKLADSSRAFNDAMENIKNDEEDFWSKLTTEEQMSAFNCVIRRLYEGEIVQQRSYRGVLYDVFGFGPEAYARAQMAGFLAVHNAIVTIDEESKQLAAFAKFLGVDVTNEKIDEFLLGKYL